MPWLSKCLESTKPYAVVVVDNNSKDDTVNFIKSNYPGVNLLQQSKNLGFGQANNLGMSYALKQGADYVFLLNQDAYLEKDTIEKLVEVHNKTDHFGILSPIHLNGRGSRLDQQFSHYLNYTCNKDFFSDYVLNKTRMQVYQVPYVNAAGWLLSRECIEKVGGFDPIFFHYGEDINYCQRVIYHGFKIGVVPEAKLLHDRENRSGQQIAYGERKYFQAMERQLKLKYADISNPWDPELDNLIRKRRNSWLKTTIKLDFKRASFFKREYSMFKCLKSEVLLSRDTNKLQGLNYLKFKDQ
jgi:GT2 family glycosyltransferase